MESLEVVKSLEEEGELTDQEQLTIHILRGKIYVILQQYENGYEDYTKDRDEFQDNYNVSSLIDEIKKNRKQKNNPMIAKSELDIKLFEQKINLKGKIKLE